MFTNHPILDIFDYICAQNAQCWGRITRSDLEIQRYPSVEPLGLWTLATKGTQELYEIARHLDVDVKELLVSSK